MNEFKFRAWSIERQCWVYFGIDNVPSWVHPAEVEQYTGLQDKNGKEIYDGDILRLSYKEYEVNFRRNVQVKWSSGGWWHVEVRNDDGMSIDTLFVGYCHDDSEVIGNIYENPELCCMGCEECIPEEDHP